MSSHFHKECGVLRDARVGSGWLRQCGAGRSLSRSRYRAAWRRFRFGLSVLTMVYAVGHVSGGHFNPAVTVGLCAARAPQALAGVAIGLALTLIHLVSIPVTNTSVNPARSTRSAIFVGGWAIRQLWLFWLAPIVGTAFAGLAYRFLAEGRNVVEAAFAQTATPPA